MLRPTIERHRVTIRFHSLFVLMAAALVQGQTAWVAPAPVSPFKHVIVIFQENRTPDNLFHGLCAPPYGTRDSCSAHPSAGQYNIQTRDWADKATSSGVIQPGVVPLANHYDFSHAHSAFIAMCDSDPYSGACRMDGAAAIPCGPDCLPHPQFRYVDNAGGTLNPYLELATRYGWSNYMFQTNQGPSYPAHQFIFGGTSAPDAADDAAGIFASENIARTGITGTHPQAGCTAPVETRVQTIEPDGVEDPQNQIYPCFEHRTLADVLPPAVTWRYYAPSAASIWTAPNSIEHICQSTGPGGECIGSDWTNNVDLKPADVLSDISNCHLRSLSWVIPTGANSDHAKANDGGGPSWVASIVNAIGNSASCDNGAGYWRDTAILITWDDWGGWYDHEPPSLLPFPDGGYQLGFRVPLIFVSAYTPRHYINNAHQDFGSVLRFIERNFGIEPGILNFADARARSDLFDFFTSSLPARSYRTIDAPLRPASFSTIRERLPIRMTSDLRVLATATLARVRVARWLDRSDFVAYNFEDSSKPGRPPIPKMPQPSDEATTKPCSPGWKPRFFAYPASSMK